MTKDMGASLRDRAATPSGPSQQAVSGIAGIPSAGTYRFAELVEIALLVFDYPVSKYIPITGNLKYLQRQRAIPHYAMGRGRFAAYSYDDVLRSLFGLELHSIGLTPTQITPILDAYWPALRRAAENGGDLWMSIPTAAGRKVTLGIQAGEIAKAMSTRRAKTPKAVEGRSPASAVPEGHSPKAYRKASREDHTDV